MWGKGASLEMDAPWRVKPLPRIHRSPVVRVPLNPYALSIVKKMQHPDPVGSGLATDAVLESAGPHCVVPGQLTPVSLLGVKVWPIDAPRLPSLDLKFLEPVQRELLSISKAMDSALNVVNKALPE